MEAKYERSQLLMSTGHHFTAVRAATDEPASRCSGALWAPRTPVQKEERIATPPSEARNDAKQEAPPSRHANERSQLLMSTGHQFTAIRAATDERSSQCSGALWAPRTPAQQEERIATPPLEARNDAGRVTRYRKNVEAKGLRYGWTPLAV